MTEVQQEPTKVAFLLAKRFSDLDNPGCLDFPASRKRNLK